MRLIPLRSFWDTVIQKRISLVIRRYRSWEKLRTSCKVLKKFENRLKLAHSEYGGFNKFTKDNV